MTIFSTPGRLGTHREMELLKAPPIRRRIGIVSIKHESNTFLPQPTTLECFKQGIFLQGEDIRQNYRFGHHEVSGFLQGVEAAGHESVPLVMFAAGPSGVITAEAIDELWRLTLEQFEEKGPFDAILAAPHGAGVGEGSRQDLDGWWLTELRKMVGPKVPIMATIDSHCNLTNAMVSACDFITSYRENPHIDQRQRGLETAEVLARTLKGGVKPTMRAAFPRVQVNIEAQGTREEPMLSIIREVDKIRAMPGILSVSVVMGFPYADVPEMGTSFIVVTDGDPNLAEALVNRLEDWLNFNRDLYKGNLIDPEQALARAIAAKKPVGLLDMGDNMGGGSPADSTLLAHMCHKMDRVRTFVCLADPGSVILAERAGVGGQVRLKMGGHSHLSPAAPLEAEVEVKGLFSGKYRETEARHGGQTHFDMGATAVVVTQTGLTVMLTSRRAFPGSLSQLTSCKLSPEDYDIIILKGVHSPVAAYDRVCATLIRVNTPGMTTADMVNQLSYRRRRKPLYPFETGP